jgi:glycosyltransferase involved in cell wall biosynthesis
LEVRVLFVDRRRDGPTAYYRMRSKIARAVNEFDPDVIHVMYGGVMADQVTRHHRGQPVVVTFHGSDLLGENLSGWTRKIISRYGVYCSRRAARAADGVIVVARHLLRALHGAVPLNKVHVIPCGIDLERFKPMNPLLCKQKLGWSIRSFHVLFASSSGDPVKRPELARAAVAQMSESERPAEFHYLSGIPTAEMPLWLNAGDALLLTSLHEGSPNIVKEALACGLPVVSVDVGDVAERIEGVEGCYLARSGPADLAAKLSLVRQRAQRLECGARLEELSILNIAHKLKRCYEEISRERSARRYTTRGGRSLPAIHSAEQAAASVRQ